MYEVSLKVFLHDDASIVFSATDENNVLRFLKSVFTGNDSGLIVLFLEMTPNYFG